MKDQKTKETKNTVDSFFNNAIYNAFSLLPIKWYVLKIRTNKLNKYNKDFEKLIELHASLHKNCAKYLNDKK